MKVQPKEAEHEDDVYGTRNNKWCRVCSDFKSWMKQQNKPSPESASSSSSPQPSASSSTSPVPLESPESKSYSGCPLNRDELGRHTWGFIHTMAAYYPKEPTQKQQNDMKLFIQLFSMFYPCDYCAKDLRKNIAENPPQTNSRVTLSQWWCDMHNKVNAKLGKPLFDCTKVDERWFKGWSDGSCD